MRRSCSLAAALAALVLAASAAGAVRISAVSAGRYHVHLDPALTIDGQESKEGLMQRVVDRFQEFIKERPDQWYAFRPMFSR